jgi:predicted Ser/Thr protein kinase
LNKHKVFAEFNKKRGWYEIVIGFNDELNVIGTTFMKPIKKEHLKRLLEMASYLDALLLNHGDEIIDENVIENLG